MQTNCYFSASGQNSDTTISEMTYIVLNGTLHTIHKFTQRNRPLPANEHAQASRSVYRATPARWFSRHSACHCLLSAHKLNAEDRPVPAESPPIPPQCCHEHPATCNTNTYLFNPLGRRYCQVMILPLPTAPYKAQAFHHLYCKAMLYEAKWHDYACMRLRGFRAVRRQKNGGLPLTLTVTLTTGQHYRATKWHDYASESS